ncbi:hypothetical protein HDA36_006479 [Nocardiopsis composta]|uniref:Uncharacterized protein n=1 Tax=Nocardiopsis composta TaxID=157465 RepID=A0A7W8VHM3_9ACTN|nr:hypothetical protein [Nocardiopsis composta]
MAIEVRRPLRAAPGPAPLHLGAADRSWPRC